ncbi:hypothetical protein BDZ94DRAFT_1174028 [Collybia nuda]|uniref:FAD-binding PCMH-type domain-containing protein n=1 Tax=Collybia nuda TaxID=64659 RepID=A0A9P6CEP4_9AGAR|nr:hypothetical protein BDZ94DRAFT_1174028 [Collybia nuda]
MNILWFALPFTRFAFGKLSCRCLYGEKCWPKVKDFSDLASQLSQPLLHPKPPGSACYPPDSPSENCSKVMVNMHNSHWRSDQSGSMQAPNFETHTFLNGTISACYIDTMPSFPCTQGSIPEIGVDARSIQDVQAAVKFSLKHTLRLVIKNTGHDYLGRSTARGGFLLWMHNLKNITYNLAFVPSGAPPDRYYQALTVGAGVQWHEAYEAAETHGRVVLGATAGSIGAGGGWIMGGGHGALAARHGLGVDNVLEFEVVTAGGVFLTVNAYKNPDLFWALRGGGGGTYAVVLSTTYVTHDPVPLTIVTGLVNFKSPVVAKRVITEFVRILPSLADSTGWGGYAFLSRNELSLLLVAPNITVDDADATLEPFFTFTKSVTVGGVVQHNTTHFDSFYSWYSATFSTDGETGTNVELGSRLIPRNLAEHNPETVADAMLALPHSCRINFVAGGAVSSVDPEATGLHPDWRKAIALVYYADGWEDKAYASLIESARKRIRKSLEILGRLGSATYFNEASLYEKDPQETFFGSHYKRLKVIRDKYDPVGLLVVAGGVGSEDWDHSLNCRR